MTSKKTQQIFVFIGKVLHLHHVLQQKEKNNQVMATLYATYFFFFYFYFYFSNKVKRECVCVR